jgi:hypothetical protein
MVIVYDQFLACTFAHSTTCNHYTTLDVPATNALAALCPSHGQRAFIGRSERTITINARLITSTNLPMMAQTQQS